MSVRDLTDDEILEHLKKNTLQRNNQLSILVKLLDSLKSSTTLAIDGAWGSGKTVFIKQLQMLADETVKDYGNSFQTGATISQLRENQKVFYFNAWESDYIGDGLSAILLKLIADSDEGLNEAAIKRVSHIINPAAAIKKLSYELIDPSAKTSKDKLLENVKSLVDRHDAVNTFLNDLKNKGDKQRVVFIIDELDRCKPSFAIDLLEVIKHYFVRDDITFIIATNIRELSHTVQKYYGYNFDGYGYLNKFFDFTIGLQKVDIATYARDTLDWVPNSYVVHEVAHDAIRHFDLEMREINAYHSALQLIDNFLSREGRWRDEQHLVQLIFVPLALVLKIKDHDKYLSFTHGKGEAILREFMPHTDSGLTFARHSVTNDGNFSEEQMIPKIVDAVASQYAKLFMPGEYRGVREDLKDFNDAVSLMSSYTTIPEPKKEDS